MWVYPTMILKGWKEHFDKSVRKTLTIPAWLNTAAQEEGINFSKTLQEALMSKLKAH